MEKSVKRKIVIVLIAFILLSVPVIYIALASIKLDEANNAYLASRNFSDDDKMNFAIRKIDEALNFNIFDNDLIINGESLRTNKVQLLFELKKYREALECLQDEKSYFFYSYLYECLNKPDSAKIYYRKEIPILKNQLKESRLDTLSYLMLERQIALHYTFLGEKENAKKYLKPIPDYYEPILKESFLDLDNYIENYVSGGFLNYYKSSNKSETVEIEKY